MLCLSIPTPGFPRFYCILGANYGSLLHGDVSMMCNFILIQCIHNMQLLVNSKHGNALKSMGK